MSLIAVAGLQPAVCAARRVVIDDMRHENSIIYSLDLETFMDGNGDGVGDFEGLSGRLDYLHALSH